MTIVLTGPRAWGLSALLALPATAGVLAQELPAASPNATPNPNIVVEGKLPVDPTKLAAGPELKGVITARTGEKIKVTAPDGTKTVVTITDATRIKSSNGLFGGGGKQTADALLNGLPVTVKTLQGPDGLVASQVTFKGGDLKTAMMIRNGTDQRFAEQAAATEALRSRVADIDNYNIKSTTNVYFATGRTDLSEHSKEELCSAASSAEGTNNALLLVVGYTDSTGGDDFNQTLSEKRAAKVINYLQQACHWKPYRMLTPTGMAKADPAADNSTQEGRAQNRRVAVNVLVSKGLDGM